MKDVLFSVSATAAILAVVVALMTAVLALKTNNTTPLVVAALFVFAAYNVVIAYTLKP